MTESVPRSSTAIISDLTVTRTTKVLHVDDDPDYLKVAEQCLKKQGKFQVDTARSAEEAMEMMEKETYDAIVSDYQMPGKDGLQFLKELRQKGNSIPFIIFTGKGREEVVIKALNQGADHYENKNGDPETVYSELSHDIINAVRTRRAEQELRIQREELQIILDSMPAKIWYKDRNNRLVRVNKAFAEYMDVSKENLEGKPLCDLFPPDIAQKCWEEDKEVITTGQPKTDILDRHESAQGVRWFSTGKVPCREKDGNIIGTINFSVDITERKKAEEALLAQRDRLETVTKNIGAGLAIISKDYRTLWANDVLKRIFGDVEGKICYSTYNQRNDICPECGVQEIFETGKAKVVHEQVGKDVDGKTIWSEITATPVKDRDGNITAVLELVVPITQRKRAEDELHDSEGKYGKLFDEAMDAIFVADAETGILIDCNRAASELVGREKSELIGKHQRILHPPEKTEEEFSTTFKQHLKEKEGRILETQVITKKGEIKEVAVKGNILELGNKRVVQGIFRDITEHAWASSFPERNPNPILEVDLDGNTNYLNPAGQKLRSQLRGLKLSNAFEKELKTLVDEFKIHRKGNFVCENVKIGDRYYQQSIYYFSEKNVLRLYMIDVTERKKAEQTLEESEEKYRSLVELAPDGIVAVNTEGIVTSANHSFLTLVGYDSEEIVGKPFTELKTSRVEDILKMQEMFKSLMKGESPSPVEFLYVRRDGMSRWAEVHPSLLVKDGNPVGAQVIMRDVSERKNAEKLIQESQQKFEGLFRHNPEAAVCLDLDSKVLDVNPRFCELFGYSAKEVEGKRINEVVVPEDMIEEAETLDKDAKKGYASRDTVRKRKDGSLVRVSISATPVTTEGKFFGYVGVYKDITKLKNAEERLKEMNKKLEVTNEKLRVVGSLTRHDVRNKLSAVTGNAYLLRRKLAEDPKALQQLTDMETAVRLVGDIFEFAGTYEKLGVERPNYMDVGKAVDEAVSLFSDLKGVKIVNECDGLTLLADSLLRQLVYNLVDNSLKHGEKTRQIKTYYRTPSADQLELVYEDDGVGIPNNMRSNLFKEGFTSGKGTGYGLFMIKRMCEVYGWTIQETGKQGKGAQFTMLIPRIGSTGKANYQIQKPRQR